MRNAGTLLTLLAAPVAAAGWLLRDRASLLFSRDRALGSGLAPLTAFIGPLLLAKAAAGLYGQFFAVTSRGYYSTRILLVVHLLLGLPAAYCWAYLQPTSAERAVALMQANTASWIVATGCFWIAYLRSPTHDLSAPIAPGVATGTNLAKPLLGRDGRPAV